MATPFIKQWLPALVCALGLGPSAALAAADTFGVGSGRNGPLAVPAFNSVINSYAPVTRAVAARATTLPIGACQGAAACFAGEDLVLVYQATGLEPSPASGAQDPIDVGTLAVGRWELARVASVSTGQLELSEPLLYAYAANTTQVIRVPEYTKVTIEPGRSLTAPPWNGTTGGVIAFLSNGEVDNRGEINANALGFRGGQFVNGDPAARGCSDLDEAVPRGAQKGEGLVLGRYGDAQTGRGNVANGAGGAVCYRSGGGGGGNGGAGGQGGRSESSDGSRNVGGRGGAAISHGTSDSVLRRLTFGGGGGAAHGISSGGGAGGAGGGVIFLRANQLLGNGTLSASGGLSGTVTEAGGGGGAGGSIYVRIVRAAACGLLSASGGIGGTTNVPRVGPGGGGGAGHLVFQRDAGGSCNLLITGASSGTQQDPSESAYGATAGSSYTATELQYGFIIPAPPVVARPGNGSFIRDVRPDITGTARPNLEVILTLDGQEIGRATTDSAGRYTFKVPQDLSEGPHTVVAVAAVDAVQSLNSVPDTFTVDITPPDTQIKAGPGKFTRNRDVVFEFGATEEGVTYLCKLDAAADFSPCPTPITFPGLGDGSHTVQVYARDRAGNQDDSPASASFQITVADLSLLGDGVGGCSATGQDASLLVLALGVLVTRLRGPRPGPRRLRRKN